MRVEVARVRGTMERIKGGGAWNGGGKSGNGLGPDKSQEEGQGDVGGGWGSGRGGRGQEVLKVQHCREGGILRRRRERKGKNKDEIENVANRKIEGTCGRESRRSGCFCSELGPQIIYD